MAVPDFQSLFIPLLKFASDGNEHSLSETIETLARQLGLDEADRDCLQELKLGSSSYLGNSEL